MAGSGGYVPVNGPYLVTNLVGTDFVEFHAPTFKD
jgi:hypothetical protein